jgi:hypothetical protein
LYTIGHSTRSAREFIDVLRASSVTCVVDIRRIPRSRTNPQFNLDVLPETLRAAGLDYVHLSALGGLRATGTGVEEGVNGGWARRPFQNYADYAGTLPFREALRDLLDMASKQTCAIMCAEAVWWRCHRRIVTDHVLAHGMHVVHLLTRTKHTPASLTPFAVVDADAGVSYPAQAPVSTSSVSQTPPTTRSPASVLLRFERRSISERASLSTPSHSPGVPAMPEQRRGFGKSTA